MEAPQAKQQVATQHIVDVLGEFLYNLNKAQSGKQDVEATPLLFRTGEREKAIGALNTAESILPVVIEALSKASAVLVPLRQELESIQGGPEDTPTGLPYDSPIPTQGLSTRAFNCLASANITTFRQLCTLERGDMMKFRNLGKVTHDELVAYRAQLGVPF